MTDGGLGSQVSRRKWLRVFSAGSLGAGFVAATGAQAQPSLPGGRSQDLGARVYNIRDFGAKGDGTTLDTAALQAAIDACARDQGGMVLVPAGTFVIGTTELKSNVTLHIAAGGKLLGSADGKQYHNIDAIPLHGDSTLEDGNCSLLFAVNAENVSIEGQGTIDGQGAQFHSAVRGTPPPSGRGGAQRPYHLLFHRCRNLTVRDIFLLSSAFHSVRVIQSSYVKMEGLHIHNRVNGNNDGFHFISCERVHVHACDIECQDDACALFGSCKWITVSDCSFSTRWSVFRFGGGVAENIAVSNCLIYETTGCPIKMRCGPSSRFENMSFSNLVMDRVTGPISLNLGPRQRRNQPGPEAALPEPQNETPGTLRNITFSNIRASVVTPAPNPDIQVPSGFRPGEMKSCIALNAVGGGVIENIVFDNVHMTFPGGGTAEEAANRNVPQVAGEYFETGTLPAFALYARNVRGLTMNNVRFEAQTPDLRPSVVFDHVEDAAIAGLNVRGSKEAESLLRFIETKDALLTATRVLAPAATLLQAEGSGTANVTIEGGDLSKAAKAVAFATGASQQSVKVRT
jgi:polygalacturonase